LFLLYAMIGTISMQGFEVEAAFPSMSPFSYGMRPQGAGHRKSYTGQEKSIFKGGQWAAANVVELSATRHYAVRVQVSWDSYMLRYLSILLGYSAPQEF
jgi:hypothetical protein